MQSQRGLWHIATWAVESWLMVLVKADNEELHKRGENIHRWMGNIPHYLAPQNIPQMNGMYTQWIFILAQKGMKFWCMLQHEWTFLKTLCWWNKPRYQNTILLIWGVRVGKFIETKRENRGSQELQKVRNSYCWVDTGNGELVLNG